MQVFLRVIKDGAWGFAATNRLERDELAKTARLAVRIAEGSARLIKEKITLAYEPPYIDRWQSGYIIDPFKVPIEKKLELLMKVDELLRKDPRIKVAESTLRFEREEKIFASTEGSYIEQVFTVSGGGFSASAASETEYQTRSYPSSFDGQYAQAGYELIESMDFIGNAERIREEAIALLSAPQCPTGKMDLILEGSQLALQIHESCGHPSELDRVFGYEANYAGTSFLTTEKLRNFKYGSEIVNIVADGTLPLGLATRGYDDDGVRSDRWFLVKDGIWWGYLTNRELAHKIGEQRSRGCNRADGWQNIPIIRMTNISLLPGDWTLNDLIADTDNGILMEVNKSWSIDQRRLNFQFGCEIGRLIKNGKIVGIVKNPTYQGITPEFWGSCDAICNWEYWVPYGVINCGKGEPGQRAEMSHGASPARFRNVNVG
ncbi:MAG: TldD/PmbA family protein, partial [bacterium]